MALVGLSKHGVGANKPMECPFERPFSRLLFFRKTHFGPDCKGQTSIALLGLAKSRVGLVRLRKHGVGANMPMESLVETRFCMHLFFC